jgi:uncharacterized SAM-binding protein YcdF (DUF218 family)
LGENLRFTHKLLEERGLHPKSFILVQKPYTVRRAYAAFKKQWPDPEATCVATSPPLAFLEYFDAVNSREFSICAVLGDLQRLKLYGERGLQIAQEIPADVWDAYTKLVAAGYTARLMKV